MNRSVSRLSRHEPEPEWSYMANAPTSQPTPLEAGGRAPFYGAPAASPRRGRSLRANLNSNILFDPIIAIAALFVAGILFAIAHHAFYSSLSGDVVPEPQALSRAIMAGIILALLSKFCFLTAVGMARVEAVWSALNKRPFTIRSIDAVFDVTSNVVRLFNFEMLRKAKLASILAVIFWLLPLSIIFTPATLTVEVLQTSTRQTTVGFPIIAYNDATRFANLVDCSLFQCNAQGDVDAASMLFTYPNNPTITKVVSAFSGSTNNILGLQSNIVESTFSTKLFGPVLKCDNLPSENITSFETILRDTQSLLPNSTEGLANGFAAAVPGLTSNDTVTAFDPNLPINWNNSQNGSVQPLKTEIWIRLVANRRSQFSTCALYNASLTVQVEYNLERQNVNITAVEYMEPIPWTEATSNAEDSQEANLSSNARLSYQAVWMAIAQQLVGQFSESKMTSRIPQTTLLAASEFDGFYETVFGATKRGPEESLPLVRLIEKVSQNVTLNIFGSSQFLSDRYEDIPATLTSPVAVYRYQQRILYISYGIAILVSALCVVYGGLVRYNSPAHPDSYFGTFSAVVAATHNSDLDRLDWDRVRECDFAKIKLRYGTAPTRVDGPSGPEITRKPAFVLGDTATPNLPFRQAVRYG